MAWVSDDYYHHQSSLNHLFFNLFQHHLSNIIQYLSTLSTEFSDSFSLHLSKSLLSTLFLSRKVLCSKTCVIHLFHSLLPLPKERRTNRLDSFESLFSLYQKNKGLTAWILLCLPSPLSKNSKRHRDRKSVV